MTWDKRKLLHVLRNPYGWDEDTVRLARQEASDELVRLWALEDQLRQVVQPALTETRE
jgi:hypothetical protein